MRTNRRTELGGVNAVRALLESAGHVYQPVNLENDIGKDAYVDFLSATGEFLASAAVQVKSGRSYRRKDGYAIPTTRALLCLWASSAMPVIGVVVDEEREVMVWADLSTAAGRATSTAPIPISVEAVFHSGHSRRVDRVR